MTANRFNEVERICLDALECVPDRRTAFLDEACRDDEDLRAQVDRLLAGASKAEQFLETPPAEEAKSALSAGDHLGPYEVVARIGAGGMGEVYRARDTRLGRVVALKVVSASFAADPLRRARFEREARAIASLIHPHICALHDVGRDRNLDVLVMEHVEGETLADRLEKGPLPLGPALAIATDIAGALAAAHRHGIVHRDLKPGNVMVTREGAVKVLDFGLAKLVAPDDPRVTAAVALTNPDTLSRAGIIVGTVAYMSPEQATGGTVDARSDVFSFGALLYRLSPGVARSPADPPRKCCGRSLRSR